MCSHKPQFRIFNLFVQDLFINCNEIKIKPNTQVFYPPFQSKKWAERNEKDKQLKASPREDWMTEYQQNLEFQNNSATVIVIHHYKQVAPIQDQKLREDYKNKFQW